MNKWKRIAALAAALLAAVALTACTAGGQTTSTEAADKETAAVTSGAQTDAPAETGGAQAEKTVITIWSGARHDYDYIQPLIDAYNKENTDNIIVKYQVYTDNYQQAVDLAIQNDELPDIISMTDTIYYKYVNEGQWADLYPYMDTGMKDYFQEVIFDGYNEIDGHLYFIPTAVSTCRLFYNKEIFDRCGIAGPPATLEEMMADARLITEQLSGEGIYGFAQNMKSASSALGRSVDYGIARETGLNQGYDFKNGVYDFSGYAPTMKYWTELLSEDCAFPGCESLDIDPLRAQFAEGNIGMYFSYTHAEPGVYQNQFPMDSSKWDCAPIPTSDGTEAGRQNYTNSHAWSLNAKSANVDKAYQVYRDIFTTEEYQIGYYEGGYGISPLKSVLDKAQPSVDFKTKPWLLLSDIDTMLPKPPHQVNPGAVIVEGEDMYKTMESIYYGGADIESTLQDLSDRYNEAYRQGIADGAGQEIKLPDYDPMNP